MIFALFSQDEVDQATSVEELEKQIEKLAKVSLSVKRIRLLYPIINNLICVSLGETDNS